MINFTKKVTLLGIFQGFCLKVSEVLFYRTPPGIFVVNRLCTVFLTLFRMGIFGAPHGLGGGRQKGPLPKFCHRYPTMMKLGTVIPYLKKDSKNI